MIYTLLPARNAFGACMRKGICTHVQIDAPMGAVHAKAVHHTFYHSADAFPRPCKLKFRRWSSGNDDGL